MTAASNLARARQAASGAEFDLVISDIELPDGTGLELIRELRPRGIRGIALSGYGSEEDVKSSRAAGFDEHLIKPVLAQNLDDAIGRLANAHGPRTLAASSDHRDRSAEKHVNGQSDHVGGPTLEART